MVFSLHMKSRLMEWLGHLGIVPKDLDLFMNAFTHPSYKNLDPTIRHYERLEFLGDAVLDLVSAEMLYKESNADEGILTQNRSQMVNNENLSFIFESVKMIDHIQMDKNAVPSQKDKANFVESFFGALLIDSGYDKCREIWIYFMNISKKMRIEKNKEKKKPKIELSEEEQKKYHKYQTKFNELKLKTKNAKSILQELCQKQNLPIPEYTLISEKGPDHDRVFEVRVEAILFDDGRDKKHFALGVGKSKKMAEHSAAEALCDKIYLHYIKKS